MKSPSVLWSTAAALLLVVPFGARVLTWPTSFPKSVDAVMAKAGEVLFSHEWAPNDPLCPSGDGLGPVYNANSCVACHKQGGVGGSGGLEHNVTVFVVDDGRQQRQGVVHAEAVQFQETLRDLSPELPAISRATLDMLLSRDGKEQNRLRIRPGLHLSQRNTPALFGAKLIDEIPERLIIAEARAQRLRSAGAPSDNGTQPVGRALLLADGRIGRFGWKAQSATLSDFVRAACAGELGLGNSSQAQPAPLGKPKYKPNGLDLTDEQCDQMTAFISALPQPVEPAPHNTETGAGKSLFHQVGCTACHTPNLGAVTGLYSDLLVHRMGQDLEGSGGYNQPPPNSPLPSPGSTPLPDEWRTPPLWGIANSAPYLHDGRAATLRDAIVMHGGQALRSAEQFAQLAPLEQSRLLAFLRTLGAP